jgi:hypothetical protein
VIKVVAPAWEKVFSRHLHDIMKSAGKESANLLEAFHNNVSTKISQETGPLESFNMLSQQIPLYQQIFNDVFNRQILEIKEECKDINRIFQPVISKTMSSVYGACVRENGKILTISNALDWLLTVVIGTGSFMRMKEIMSTFVDEARETMFRQSVDAVKTALKELCQSLEEVLFSQIGKAILSVKRDYMSAVDRGVLSKEKRAALNELLKTITESESSFKQLAVSDAQGDMISPSDVNDEQQIKSEHDLGVSQEKDNASPLLTPTNDGLIKNEEGSNVNLSKTKDSLAASIQLKSEPKD